MRSLPSEDSGSVRAGDASELGVCSTTCCALPGDSIPVAAAAAAAGAAGVEAGACSVPAGGLGPAQRGRNEWQLLAGCQQNKACPRLPLLRGA